MLKTADGRTLRFANGAMSLNERNELLKADSFKLDQKAIACWRLCVGTSPRLISMIILVRVVTRGLQSLRLHDDGRIKRGTPTARWHCKHLYTRANGTQTRLSVHQVNGYATDFK